MKVRIKDRRRGGSNNATIKTNGSNHHRLIIPKSQLLIN